MSSSDSNSMDNSTPINVSPLMIDTMTLTNPLSNIGGGGMVRLVDVMPRLIEQGQTGDTAIVQAARVSYGSGTKSVSNDGALINYLLSHWHTTPFEMVEFKFHIKAPLFIARQWMRHRMASINEVSARYSVVQDSYHVPEDARAQAAVNKQGSGESIDELSEYFPELVREHCDRSYQMYQDLLSKGVCREQARMILPQNMHTEFYWKIDLHNLLHFLHLRVDSHAQKEIREFADAILAMIEPIVPLTINAFRTYRMGSVTLSRLEQEALRTNQPLASSSKREREEWEEKKKLLVVSS